MGEMISPLSRKRTMEWPCSYEANTTHPSGRRIRILGHFEGFGDVVSHCQSALRKRLRKPWLWYGVEILIYTPTGQRVLRVVEHDYQGELVLVK